MQEAFMMEKAVKIIAEEPNAQEIRKDEEQYTV